MPSIMEQIEFIMLQLCYLKCLNCLSKTNIIIILAKVEIGIIPRKAARVFLKDPYLLVQKFDISYKLEATITVVNLSQMKMTKEDGLQH